MADSSEEAAVAPGKRVKILGEAKNAKLAAAVISADGMVVYCIEISEWPDEIVDRQVEVEGVLNRTDQFRARVDKNGAISQGSSGGDLLIKQVTYRLARSVKQIDALFDSD